MSNLLILLKYSIASSRDVSILTNGIARLTLSVITSFILAMMSLFSGLSISQNIPLSSECLILTTVSLPRTSIAEDINRLINPFS